MRLAFWISFIVIFSVIFVYFMVVGQEQLMAQWEKEERDDDIYNRH